MKLKNHYRITCNYAKSIIRMESVKPKGKRLSHKKKKHSMVWSNEKQLSIILQAGQNPTLTK